MSEIKCTPFKNGYADTICDALQSVIQKTYGKGGVKAVLANTRVAIPYGDDGKPDYSQEYPLGTAITLHKPSTRVIMNFCPFCGGKIRDIA